MKPASIFPASIALLMLAAGSASADTISYLLTTANLRGFDGPYARVTVDLISPSSATVTLDSLRNGGVTYLVGGADAVDLNVNGAFGLGAVSSSNSMTGFTAGPFRDGVKGTEHGGGRFNLSVDSGGLRHWSTQLSFVLTATNGNAWDSAAQVLLPNDKGQIAAIHLVPCRESGKSCTALVHGNRSRAFASGATLDPSPVPLAAVPVPAAAWLFGSGLLGLIAAARRRGRDDPEAEPHRSTL